MSSRPPAVAEKTKEQANAVSEAVVTSVNTVATKTVEEAENIVVTAGVVRKVSLGPGCPRAGGHLGRQHRCWTRGGRGAGSMSTASRPLQ